MIKRWIQFSSVEFVRSQTLSAILKAFIVELNSGNDLDINFSGILYTTINEIAKDILGKPVRTHPGHTIKISCAVRSESQSLRELILSKYYYASILWSNCWYFS